MPCGFSSHMLALRLNLHASGLIMHNYKHVLGPCANVIFFWCIRHQHDCRESILGSGVKSARAKIFQLIPYFNAFPTVEFSVYC